jgi:hypothetical protein
MAVSKSEVVVFSVQSSVIRFPGSWNNFHGGQKQPEEYKEQDRFVECLEDSRAGLSTVDPLQENGFLEDTFVSRCTLFSKLEIE